MGGKTRRIDLLNAATLAIVAAGYGALAFADGGYSQEVIAGATIGIWLAVAIGLAARVWPRERVPGPAIATGACLAGLGVLTAVSAIWANDAGRAFFSFVRVAGYLGLFTLVVLASPRTGPRAWLSGLAVGLTAVAIASVATRFDPSLFGGGDRHLSVALPAAAGRLSYPIGYWNGLAACLAIDFALLAWLGANARARIGRAVAVALLPVPGLALYLTSSRGGLGAALAGSLALLVLGRRRVTLLAGMVLGAGGGGLLVLLAHPRGDFLQGLATSTARTEGLEMGAATLLCVLVVGVARFLLEERLARMRLPAVPWRLAIPVLVVAATAGLLMVHPAARLHEFATVDGGGGASATPGQRNLISTGGSGRYQFWEAALDAFGSRPVLGIGAGNYELYWNAHPEAALSLVNAHSLYLETLAELGIPGLALVLGFFAVPIAAAWRRAAAGLGAGAVAGLALLAAGAVSAALEWTWQLPAALAPVVVAAGLLVSAAPATGADARATRPPTRFGLGLATIAVAWACIWAAGVVLVTDLKLDSSRAAAARGDLTAAASDARDAADVEPWSVEPRLQLALVEELAGNLRAARTAAAEAIDRASDDWRTWAVAARIDARAGHSTASREERAFADALSPVPLPNSLTGR